MIITGALEGADIWGAEPQQNDVMKELEGMTDDDIKQRTVLLGNDISVMKSSINTLTYQMRTQTEKIKENKEKIKVRVYTVLSPLLVRVRT